MTIVKVALVGLGSIARTEHLPIIMDSTNFKLAATISEEWQDVGGVPNFQTVEALSRSGTSVDALVICTPVMPRFDLACAAVKAGYHVMLEKPPFSSVAECEYVMDLAAASNVCIFSAWHSRYAPFVPEILDWVEENKCSEIEVIWCEDVRKWHPCQDWVKHRASLGVFDAGINALSIVSITHPTLAPKAVLFDRPGNWQTPISVKAELLSSDDTHIKVNFDWSTSRRERWQITYRAGVEWFAITQGGSGMIASDGRRDEKVIQHYEYRGVYQDFYEAILSNQSKFDWIALQVAEDMFGVAEWRTVSAFDLGS